MEKIHIKNLKSIVDSGELDIKPVTVFVGKNSSGKSSLIRCFPLLKQSSESKTLGTILWSGKYVDYGSFDESVNNSGGDSLLKEISFGFSFHVSSRRGYLPENSLVKLTISVLGNEYHKNSYTDVTYEIFGSSIFMRVNTDLKISLFKINGVDFTKQASEIYAVYKIYTIVPVLFPISGSSYQGEQQYLALEKELTPYLHQRTSPEKIRNIARNLKFSDDETLKRVLSNPNFVGVHAARKFSELALGDSKFQRIKNQLILNSLDRVIYEVAESFRDHCASIKYITPLRAAADRYYRIRNTSIEELDPNGSNLAMFLYAKKPSEIDDINSWLKGEMGFSIGVEGSHGHASIFILDENGGSKTNIADTGFGISQILPVLIQVWQQSKGGDGRHRRFKTPISIIIEQPELHLHPKMQSKVGEAFCKAIRTAKGKGVDLRIIIETHSKEIIDAIGRSIENNDLVSDDAAIYIFDKFNDVTASRAYFGSDGFLEKWPYGFFDGE